MELSFDRILSSPYARARQTAQIVAEPFGAAKKLELTDLLAPDGSAKKLVELLNRLDPQPENVLLSGHEPYLSEFISLLMSGGSSTVTVLLKKGGLCKLTTEDLKPGRCATLEWLLTSKQMELMA